MPAVVLLIILLLVAFLLLKSFQDAKTRAAESDAGEDKESGSSHPSRARRRLPRRSREDPAPSAPPIDQEALAAHVTKLREAITKGLISNDEAAASVVRYTEGGLSDDAARKLLDTDDEAA